MRVRPLQLSLRLCSVRCISGRQEESLLRYTVSESGTAAKMGSLVVVVLIRS